MTEDQALLADAPIRRLADDDFGRTGLAERIAAEASQAPDDAGFVIAIYGPWGSGKTSLANMVIDQLDPERDLAVRFNPWIFSGTEDLIGRFFGELATSLGRHPGPLRQIALKLGGYADALSGGAGLIPGVGSTAATLMKAAGRVASLAGEGKTLEEQREALVEALAEIDGRIVVFLDDLDRLTDREIREIVRLVKLVGDLPRVTYILAFDRTRVEEALGAPETDPARMRERGRAFLEKIVQSQHAVPPLRQDTLLKYLLGRVNAAIAPYPQTQFHEHDYNNMLGLAFRYMVETPRDAIRIANALPAAMELDSAEVALTDLIGLEALRVLEPDVHAGLSAVGDILTEAPQMLGDTAGRDAERRARLDALIDRARHPRAVRALLGQLFPKANQALDGTGRAFGEESRERLEQRVSVPSVFRAYIHRSVDEEAVETGEVIRLLSLFDEPAMLRDALAALNPDKRADAIGRLVDRKDEFKPSQAVGVATVVLSLGWDLPDESAFLTGKVPGRTQLKWLIGRLLLSEEDKEGRARLVERLLEDAPDISTRLRIVQWFGTHPESGSRDPDAEMLDTETTARVLDDLVHRTAAARPEDLVREPSLGHLLAGSVAHDEASGRGIVSEKAADDAVMLALLRAHYGASASVTLGEAAVRRNPQLAWKALVSLLGEELLRARILELRERAPSGELDADTAAALEQGLAIVEGRIDPASEL